MNTLDILFKYLPTAMLLSTANPQNNGRSFILSLIKTPKLFYSARLVLRDSSTSRNLLCRNLGLNDYLLYK